MEKRNSLARLADLSTACLITLFGIGLILCTKGVSAAAHRALLLCGRVVIPSLFPFLVLSTLLLSCGPGDALAHLQARPMEVLFRLPGSCAPALVMGMIGGYPVGARTAFALYDRRACTAEECSRLFLDHTSGVQNGAAPNALLPGHIHHIIGIAGIDDGKNDLMVIGLHITLPSCQIRTDTD